MLGIARGGPLTFGFCRLSHYVSALNCRSAAIPWHRGPRHCLVRRAMGHQGEVGLSLIRGGVSGLRLEAQPQQTRECSLLQVNHYVVRSPREHRLSRFVGYVPFDMGRMSRHEDKVSWASVHVFF